MVKWLQQMQFTLNLSPNTVFIAMSIFDRYLCSGRGGSTRALEDKCKFQLAAITAYYAAVKNHEPVVLGIHMLLIVCCHAYTKDDFVSMEMNILSAINWRMSCHTVMDYARTLLELIRKDKHLPSGIANSLLNECEKHMGDVITNISSSCCNQPELGICCVAFSLGENKSLSLSEKDAIRIRLTELCDVDLTSEGGAASQQYLTRASPCKLNTDSKLGTTPQQMPTASIAKYSTAGPSSPTSVSCTARQA